MEQIFNKENYINNSNRQSTLDPNINKNTTIFFNKGKYFSFSKDNTIDTKIAPNTSSFNIRESFKKPIDINLANNNSSFLNKKRKLMTSEELELEQIQREREEVKKMMKKNMDLYNRTKSGTTTIVSKVRDTILGLNNLGKNNVLNNNIIKANSYANNFSREKALNRIKELNKKINENNIKREQSQQPNLYKIRTIEIINTDILPEQINLVNNETDKNCKKSIELNEEKENNEEDILIDKDIKLNEEIISDKKTPLKENSYLTKIKELGSMSKLSLCNKIQKYTEICKQVLKEQENGEIEINKESDKKQKKGRKKKKSSKK